MSNGWLWPRKSRVASSSTSPCRRSLGFLAAFLSAFSDNHNLCSAIHRGSGTYKGQAPKNLGLSVRNSWQPQPTVQAGTLPQLLIYRPNTVFQSRFGFSVVIELLLGGCISPPHRCAIVSGRLLDVQIFNAILLCGDLDFRTHLVFASDGLQHGANDTPPLTSLEKRINWNMTPIHSVLGFSVALHETSG